MMTASLRNLRRTVDALGLRLDEDYRSRVGIQARLSADERAQYQRRYETPPEVQAVLEGQEAPPADPVPAAAEPSFVADLTEDDVEESHTADTEPKAPDGLRDAISEQQDQQEVDEPVVPPEHAPFMRPPSDAAPARHPTPPHGIPAVQPEVAEPEPEPEPAPAPEVIEPPVLDESRRPTPPRGIPAVQPEVAEPEPEPEPAPAPEVIEPPVLDESRRPTPPRGIPAVQPEVAELEPEPEPAPAPAPEVIEPPVLDESQRPTPPRGIPAVQPAADEAQGDLPPQTPVTDTGEISIWEVFGLRRPSEQDADALHDLVQSVHAKQRARHRQQLGRYPARVRWPRAGLGLRLRLALRAVRVRLRR
jgi:hypothetical protein